MPVGCKSDMRHEVSKSTDAQRFMTGQTKHHRPTETLGLWYEDDRLNL